MPTMLCCRNVSAVVPSTDDLHFDNDASSSSTTMKSPPSQQQPQHHDHHPVIAVRQAWRKKSFGKRSSSRKSAAEPASAPTAQPSVPQASPTFRSEETLSATADDSTVDGIFRRPRSVTADAQDSFWSEERTSMLSLKRANPVFDSDDEDDEEDYQCYSREQHDYGLSSPFKRMRSNLEESSYEEGEEADRREEDEDRHYDRSRGTRDDDREVAPSSPVAHVGPGQSYYLPQPLWKNSSGATPFPFMVDTDDESDSSDDYDRERAHEGAIGERIFWDSRVAPESSSSS